MICPNCNSPLTEATLHGENVDRCQTCCGVWFDERELSAVLACMTNTNKQIRTTRRSLEDRSCPRCLARMPVSNYAYDSGITISRCNQCSGVWLDQGQLEAIAQYRAGTPSTNALANAHSAKLSTENRWRFLQNVIRSRSASGTVALLYVIAALALRGPEASLRVLAFVMFPLACIWFADGLGNLTGISLGLGRPAITKTSPGEFVAIGGWFLLLCPVFVAFFLR